jgi:hypothetical protein
MKRYLFRFVKEFSYPWNAGGITRKKHIARYVSLPALDVILYSLF